MPSRLRPTAPVAADAILVGDPGRALMLAQELLESPKMSNHARGLWGYSGRTPAGAELTIQATGIGGPSAAAVLADLAKLGVRRAIRVGTCAGLGEGDRSGEILLASEAVAAGGSAAAFGVEVGEALAPDPALLEGLRRELRGEAREARVGSFDAMPVEVVTEPGIEAADMQSAALLARARQLDVAAAVVLVVAEVSGEEARISDEALEAAAKAAGRAASAVVSA
jgi:uridine phosphorylase